MTAQARTLICNYTDSFHTASSAPPNTHLLSAPSYSGSITSYQTGPSSFAIKDAQPNPSECDMTTRGSATVVIGSDSANYCTLTLIDGAAITDPLVQNINCQGNFHYNGISYDGTWSYSYTLQFSNS
jgi:hypothetical protein